MKYNKYARNIYLVLTLSLICLFSLNITGCTSKNDTNKDSKNITQKMDESTTSLYKRANNIATSVTSIPGIKKANVLISEESALIGVNIENNSEGKITDELKNSVAEKVKSTDKNIKHVGVSADTDVVTRVNNINDGVKNGKPVSSFTEEIKELFNRILPN